MSKLVLWLPLAAVLIVGSALAFDLVSGGSPSAVTTPISGRPAPALDVPVLDGGGRITNDDLKGKPRLLNFFASWCGPCAAESDVLMGLHNANAVEIVGVALKDSPAPLKAFLDKRGNPYARLGLDNSGSNAIEWGLTGVPETFAIAADGTVVAHHIGQLTQSDANKLLRDLDLPVP